MTISKDEVERARLVSEYKYQLERDRLFGQMEAEMLGEHSPHPRFTGPPPPLAILQQIQMQPQTQLLTPKVMML